MTLPTIDTHEFTRRGDAVEGTAPLAGLERLATMLVSDEGVLAWRLAGRSELRPDGSRSPFLHLAIDGAVRMRCVRCLEPVGVPLAVERDYRLVATEAQAEQEDADEEEVDLLVSSRRFDLAALVEDEAIMALPGAPRHDDCSAPEVSQAPADDGEAGSEGETPPPDRSPFAALAALKAGGPGRGGPSGEPDRDEPGGGGADTDGDDSRPRRRVR